MFSTEGMSGNIESASVFEPGVNQVKFKNFEFKSPAKDGSGDKAIIITFENDKEVEMNTVIFPPNEKAVEFAKTANNLYDVKINAKGDKVAKSDNLLTDKQAQELVLYRIQLRMAEFVYAVVGEDIPAGGGTFSEFAKAIYNIVKPKIGAEVKVGVQYDKKGYLKIGKPDNSQRWIDTLEGKNLAKIKLKTEKPNTPTPDNDDVPTTSTTPEDNTW